MYTITKFTENPNTTKYELCNLYIIQNEHVFLLEMFQSFHNIYLFLYILESLYFLYILYIYFYLLLNHYILYFQLFKFTKELQNATAKEKKRVAKETCERKRVARHRSCVSGCSYRILSGWQCLCQSLTCLSPTCLLLTLCIYK